MSTKAIRKILMALSVLGLTMTATIPQNAHASDCSQGDPWFFCQCARLKAQQCSADYQACGGFLVPGCWDTYVECRADSGVDTCE